MRTVIALLGLASLAWAQTGATLDGRTVNAVSGEPIRRVNLTLERLGGGMEPIKGQSDANGHFTFTGLEQGSYHLIGERNTYLRGEYGAGLRSRSGVALTLTKGQAMNGLQFKLTPVAVISGRVVDERGEPLQNIMVVALERRYVRARKEWRQASGTMTNDRGEFRIADLKAGTYMVQARHLNVGMEIAAGPKGDLPQQADSGYAATWFGNTVDMARSTPVEVRAGEERRGTEIQMTKTPTVRIRGRVDGSLDGKILLIVASRKSGDAVADVPGSVGLVQSSDGAFELRDVLPGEYLLHVRLATDMTTSMNGPVEVQVGEKHLDGIVVKLAGGLNVNGTVTPAPKKDRGKSIWVSLDAVDFTQPDAPKATAAEDGHFTLHNVFNARYRVVVADLPDDVYVKSIKLGGHEVDDSGTAFAPGGNAQLEIETSAAGARVEGKVVGASDEPLPGATVVLIPKSGKTSLYKTTSTDTAGAYSLHGITPGEYTLLAWDDVEPGAWLDAEFVKPFAAAGTKLTLDEGTRTEQKLTAVVAK